MKCDVAVIGGGVIGLACAWRLAQGGAKVALFERGTCGREASWAAAGMLAPLVEAARHPPKDPAARAAMLDLCLQSRDLYRALSDELKEATQLDIRLEIDKGRRFGWSVPGILYVATDENDQAPQRFAELSKRDSIQKPQLDDFRSIRLKSESALQVGGYWPVPPANSWRHLAEQCRVFWLEHEGQVDSRHLTKALFRALKNIGVEIYQSEPVREFFVSENKVVGFRTSQRSVSCEQVLLSVGAWSGRIRGLPPDCVPPTRPVRGQMVALSGGSSLGKIVYSSDVYFVPKSNGELWIGATMEEAPNFLAPATAEGVSLLLDSARKVWPVIDKLAFRSTWAGLRPATPDGLPILGRTPLENLFVATGHFRNGILLTPITAQLMADCILNGKEPPAEFSINRFHTS